MCSALSRSCTVLVNLSATALEGSQAHCLSGNFKRMHCPVKSVLRLIGNGLNLSYVFIVYCRLISAWQFVAFLGSCKLNGSLKNSILYIYCSIYLKWVLLSCSCRNALPGMIMVQGDYALRSFALLQRSFVATASVLVLFVHKLYI